MALWSQTCAWFSISTVHWAGTCSGSVSWKGLAIWEAVIASWAGNDACTTEKHRWKCYWVATLVFNTWPIVVEMAVYVLVIDSSWVCDFSVFKHYLKRKILRILLYIFIISAAVVLHGHRWYNEELYEEYQEGLQSPGMGSKGLWTVDCFFTSLPSQREELWKGWLNLGNRQTATELVPQPGVRLLRPCESLWETDLLGDYGVHLTDKRKSIFGHRLVKLVKRALN